MKLKVPTELATSPLPGHEDAAELMAKGVRQLKEEVRTMSWRLINV